MTRRRDIRLAHTRAGSSASNLLDAINLLSELADTTTPTTTAQRRAVTDQCAALIRLSIRDAQRALASLDRR